MRLHDLERWLAERGWQLTRITGSHRIYRHNRGGTLTIAAHGNGKAFGRIELRHILRSIRRTLERGGGDAA